MEEHIETFNATAEGKGWPTIVNITNTNWNRQVDEPEKDGGSNSGPNPMQHFVAALASCQNEQAQIVKEELSLNIDKIEIDLAIDLNLAGFMGKAQNSEGCYKKLVLNTIVHGDITEKQVAELGKKVDNRCPVLSLLRSSGCEIISSWKIS